MAFTKVFVFPVRSSFLKEEIFADSTKVESLSIRKSDNTVLFNGERFPVEMIQDYACIVLKDDTVSAPASNVPTITENGDVVIDGHVVPKAVYDLVAQATKARNARNVRRAGSNRIQDKDPSGSYGYKTNVNELKQVREMSSGQLSKITRLFYILFHPSTVKDGVRLEKLSLMSEAVSNKSQSYFAQRLAQRAVGIVIRDGKIFPHIPEDVVLSRDSFGYPVLNGTPLVRLDLLLDTVERKRFLEQIDKLLVN